MLDPTSPNSARAHPQPGVVACALYRDGQRVGDASVEEMRAVAGRKDGILWLGILWLGLYEPSAALLETVQAQLGLHELMIEDATQAHQPRNWTSMTV